MKTKRISKDEVISKRQGHIREGSRGPMMTKAFKSPPSWNPEKKSARFVMSSESIDRYRDSVVQAGLDITRFNENPQALLFHNSRSWPIGNWSDVQKLLNGRPKRTEGTLAFVPDGVDEDADRAARHVAVGTLRTVSIGFIPNWDEVEMILDDEEQWTGGFRYPESELIECSLVPVPAQPDALVKDAGGDWTLAKEIIEDILDNWAKTPEGLLMPRAEYEAKHLDLVNQSRSVVIPRNLAESIAKLSTAGMVDGSSVSISLDDNGVAVDVVADLGEINTDEGNDGTTAAVDAPQTRDAASGDLLVAFLAQAKAGDSIGVVSEEREIESENGFRRYERVPGSSCIQIRRGDTEVGRLVTEIDDEVRSAVDERRKELAEAKNTAGSPTAPVVGEVSSSEIIVPVKLDTKEAEEEIGRLGGLIDGIFQKLAQAFGVIPKKTEPERVEPVVVTPISPEEAKAARTRAAELLEGLKARGRI